MNHQDFVEYVNGHLPPGFSEVTLEDLKRWEKFGVLRPDPEYHPYHYHTVVGLMKMEQELKKRSPERAIEAQSHELPSLTSRPIYQVLSFLTGGGTEDEAKERATIRLALIHTGLISAPGFVCINFSPFTGSTLESLLNTPEQKSFFEKASASKALAVTQEAVQFVEDETGKEMLKALNPVLFIPGVRPTALYSTFIFGSKGRFLGPGQYLPLTRPLYEEFLDLDVRHSSDIINFMAMYHMLGSFGVPRDKDDVSFVRTAQQKMREVLMKATKGSLGAIDLAPLSPFHEDDVVQADRFGEMIGMDIFTGEGKPVSVGEIKALPAYECKDDEWFPYDNSMLRVKRYYSWLDFLWAEFIDATGSGSYTPVCLRCGKLLPQNRGRRKTYCGPENTKCYHARKAEHVRKCRSKGQI